MNVSEAIKDHVLCLLPFPEDTSVTARLKQEFPNAHFTVQQTFYEAHGFKTEEIPDEIWQEVTILFTGNNFPANVSRAPNLRLVHLITSGVNHIQEQPIYTSSSVPITCSTGVAAPMMAEWVMLMMLAAEHKYNMLREWQMKEQWGENGKMTAWSSFFNQRPACGQRIGILGYGAVGRQVANLSRALGMNVVAFTAKPRLTVESRRNKSYAVPGTGDPEGVIPSQWFHGTDKAALHEFLGQDLDYLLISLPLTRFSRKIIGKEEFKVLAKRNAFIINVSRGETFDHDALFNGLEKFEQETAGIVGAGRRGLRGAALDTTDPEPLPPGHPLWSAPNCVVTPHISSIFSTYPEHSFKILELNMRNLAEGKKLINLVSRDTGYVS